MPRLKKDKEQKETKVVKTKKEVKEKKDSTKKKVTAVKSVKSEPEVTTAALEEVVQKETKREQKGKAYYGLGRRKRSVARVWLFETKGDITINGKLASDYIASSKFKVEWQKPFHIVGISHPTAKFSGSIKVNGGGITGQLEAVLLGISRALISYNNEFKPKLRDANLVTRDSREVESKKVYLKKARKAPQYSKR